MVIAQHPDRAWKKFAEELPVIRDKRIALFTTYKIATGSMFRKMESTLTGKIDPSKLNLKSRRSGLTDNNNIALEDLINS